MLIASGQIKITLSIGKNTIVHLATVGRGQFFGEMFGNEEEDQAFAQEQEELADAQAAGEIPTR